MTKKQTILMSILTLVLMATNVATVAYYTHKASEMRQQSSFKIIFKTGDSTSFKKCLDKHDIENRVTGAEVSVREVDQRDAIMACS